MNVVRGKGWRERIEFHSIGPAFVFQIFAVVSYAVILDKTAGIYLPLFWYPIGIAFSFLLNSLCYRLATGSQKLFVSLSPLIFPVVLVSAFFPKTLAIYLFTVGIAILSKFTLRWKGRHIFNPGVLGVAATSLLFHFLREKMPFRSFVPLSPGLAAYAWTMGPFVAFTAGRLWASSAYMAGTFGLLRVLAFFPALAVRDPFFLGLNRVIFIFHALTDPATCPASPKRQVFFGVGLAAIDVALVVVGVKTHSLVSLCLICLAFAVLLPVEKKRSVPEWGWVANLGRVRALIPGSLRSLRNSRKPKEPAREA